MRALLHLPGRMERAEVAGVVIPSPLSRAGVKGGRERGARGVRAPGWKARPEEYREQLVGFFERWLR